MLTCQSGIDSWKLFRIWLGVTEYLFRSEVLLDEVIKTAIEDNTFRSDDLEFTFAARVSGATNLVKILLLKSLALRAFVVPEVRSN